MKLGSFSRTLAAIALALMFTGGAAVARPQHDAKTKSQYPNATRQAPKLDLHKRSDQEKLNKGLNAIQSGDKAKAQKILQPMASGKDTNSKYAQAMALQGLANLKYNGGDTKGAIADLQKSLDIGVMPNDTYFQLMYELAQFQLVDKQYSQALATLHKWRAQGKRETADSYALEGNIDYRLQKYPQAITAMKKAMSMTDKPKANWSQILMASYSQTGNSDAAAKLAEQQAAANPNDSAALHNAVSVLVQSKKYPQALQLMEKARSNGALKSKDDYMNMAKLYLLIGQNQSSDAKSTANAKKAQQVVQEGLKKGILKPGYEVYKLEGDAAYTAGNTNDAIDAYKKAAPLATDGQSDLILAQVYNNAGKYREGRKAAKDAISKGLKSPGRGYMLLAQSEQGLKHKSAAVAAMKKAAQDPKTSAQAKKWLKSAGH